MSARNKAVLFALFTILASRGGGFSARAGNHALILIFLVVTVAAAVTSGVFIGISRR